MKRYNIYTNRLKCLGYVMAENHKQALEKYEQMQIENKHTLLGIGVHAENGYAKFSDCKKNIIFLDWDNKIKSVHELTPEDGFNTELAVA